MNKPALLCLLCVWLALGSVLGAKEAVIFLPKESKQALSSITKAIANAKTSIKIAMYSFRYKKIAKELIQANKRGVNVYVVFDDRVLGHNEKSQYKYLTNHKYIKTYTLGRHISKNAGKLHAKYMIVDDTKVLFGSLNYTKKSFKNNYEVLYITNNAKIAKKFVDNFAYLLNKAKAYN